MKLEVFAPSEVLKPFVKCYMLVDCSTSTVNSMLPDTSLTLGFRFKGKTKYLTDTENDLPFAVVAGLRKSIQLMKDDTDTGNLLIVFNTAGAAAFFKEPLHDVFGEVVSLDEFSSFRTLSEIEDSLCGAKSNKQRIEIAEKFLLSKLHDYKHDPLIHKATEMIMGGNGVIKIKDLTDRLCISVDAFEKRFRKTVGASPKQFSYIVRMNKIMSSLPHKSLSQIAFDAGYYDQAHFNKDFKLFTGQTPTDFLKNSYGKNQ